MDKRQVLNNLLNILANYLNLDLAYGQTYTQDRQLFRGICNQCVNLNGIDPKFYTLQDELLSAERDEKGVVDIQKLAYKDNITIYQGDITTLNADSIVNAGNKEFLGCFVPCHSCIDNVILSCGGFEIRNELRALKSQKDYAQQPVKVTKGYNLPCKFIFHVAGPQVFGKLTEQNKQDLAYCYTNALDTAKQLNLDSIAFCCISTGLYAFPNDQACKIAVDTTRVWQQANKYNIKIIFDVFKDQDRGLYEQRLFNTHC